ncbi:uncharacterized protein FA14DRAFT_160676 [Meira miltonrushii]|uniref:Vps41 beta-propeller domain-containing protein n=1 Tax=Meira miltonrushii TaxID=1280837 RepID=A0A316VDG2_9BASI|nr:uncharacterized protein FA14DRAFT_160676 [Meira miltonrushii]PWN35596.1 hypothetical protein FA14DRAFT_160676 [Meira miltonrushii]
MSTVEDFIEGENNVKEEEREEGESNQDEGKVIALAAELASRQAAAAANRQTLYKATSDITTQDEDEPEIQQSRNNLSPQHSPTLRRARLSSNKRAPLRISDDAPRIDEEAIKKMTEERVEEIGDQDTNNEQDGPTSPSSGNNMVRSLSNRSGISQSSNAEPSRKRMTVVMDEEMPDQEDDNSTVTGDEDAESIDPTEHGIESKISNTGEDGIPEIGERDADVGEGGGTEREVEEPIQELGQKGTAGMIDLSQSLATLRAGRQADESQIDDDIARGEQKSTHETDEETEEEEEEEEEPSLKYSRLRGSVPDMFKRDSASALAVSDRFLALGMHSGSIYVLDEQGNLIKGFRTHSASVLALDIDSTAEFVGSAGMDGLVSVSSLSSSEAYIFDFKRVMRSISLEPSFGRRSTRSFVCGGMSGQLVMREKSWFGHREVILHEGEGPIWTTKWRGNFVAWTNDKGVRIYDIANKQRITFISPPEDKPRADLFRCTLYWQDDDTLIIAWGDTIKVAKIRRKDTNGTKAGASAILPASGAKATVEITAILQLDCMISGIAPRGKDFLVLAYITDEDYGEDSSVDSHRRRDGQRPELRLISDEGEELSSDILSLQSFARFQCNDYLLVPSADAVLNGANAIAKTQAHKPLDPSIEEQGNYYYVVSPKDIVIARSRDQKDHLDWLIQHKYYQEALDTIHTMGIPKALSMGFDANEIGGKYITYLIRDKQDWSKAASIVPGILKENVQAWEDVVFAFAEKNSLPYLIHQIPVEKPTLNSVVYDMILAHLLRHNIDSLLETIRTWPVEIYSTQAVVLAIEDRLNNHGREGDEKEVQAQPNSDERLLMECLAEIHLKNRQPGKALPYYLRLRKPGVFDLIRDHNLFNVIQDQALLLVEFEQDLLKRSLPAEDKQQSLIHQKWRSIELLVDHTHSIPIHRVVPQLQEHHLYLFLYLDALFDRDPQLVASYSDLQVDLYAEFAYQKLMAYLRTMSSHYSFEKAYNTCKSLDYVPEMVFLLSRIGDKKTALTLIIERLGDVERAIAFVKEEKDPELWDNLVHYSEDKPKFIRGLLENVGGEVDAVKLIRRIKDGLHIEGLRDALIKILGDFNLQISLLEGCATILTHDGRSYAQFLDRAQTEGLYGDGDVRCSTCGERLLSRSTEGAVAVTGQDSSPAGNEEDGRTNAIFFLCRHAHHLSCLISNPSSIPKRSTAKKGTASDTGLLVTMTTTRAAATGQLQSAGAYGPMQRAHQRKAQVQEKVLYQNRLRVVLKKGCPICRADREQFRL